jgi:hypothetical protein
MSSYQELPLKEKTAIELKYLGNTHREISEKLGVPFDTIQGWFESNGKLFEFYQQYVRDINIKREQDLLNSIKESDENIFITTTNAMRRFAKRLENPKFRMSPTAYKIMWEIQRTMQGLPTDVKKQDMTFNQKELDEEAELIKKSLRQNNESDILHSDIQDEGRAETDTETKSD